MKTYLLRPFPPVQRQKRLRSDPPQPPSAARVEPVLAAGSGPALYVGLDVHNDSIAVSLAPSDSTEVRRYWLIGGPFVCIRFAIHFPSSPRKRTALL